MAPAAAPPRDLFDNLDRRIQQQRMDNEADFEETYQLNQDNAIDVNRL